MADGRRNRPPLCRTRSAAGIHGLRAHRLHREIRTEDFLHPVPAEELSVPEDKDDSGFIEDPDHRPPTPPPGGDADGEAAPEGEAADGNDGAGTSRSKSERLISNSLGKGAVIGRCRIDRRIGRGGIGVVYLAHHLTLDAPVAVKVLRPDVMEQPGNFAERFMQEARLAARIRHPNVMSVMDADKDGETGLYYIVLEFIDGGTVRDLLRKGPVPVEQALEITTAVADALEEAAKHGVIHRDIKPDNIMLTASGRVKLADLGLGKELEGDALSLTERESVFGTPAYMSPEQAEDSRKADIRSDIYSLGATLVHVLTGHRPFEGQSTYNILKRLGSERIPDPRTLRPEIPEAVAAICLKMTARSILERYQSPTALLKDLRKVMADPDLPASEILALQPGEQAGNDFFLEEPPQPTRPASPLEASGGFQPAPAAYGPKGPRAETEDEAALLSRLEARARKPAPETESGATASREAPKTPGTAAANGARKRKRKGGRGTTRVQKAPAPPPLEEFGDEEEFFRDIRQREPYFLRLWRSLWYPMQALGILFFFVIGVPLVLTIIWVGTNEALQLIATTEEAMQQYFTAAVVAAALFLVTMMAAFYATFMVAAVRVGDGSAVPVIQGMDHHVHIAALVVWIGAYFGPGLAVGFWSAEGPGQFFAWTPATVALLLLGSLLAPMAFIRSATISPMAGLDLPVLFRDLARVPLDYLYLLGFIFSVSGIFIVFGIWVGRMADIPASTSSEIALQIGLRTLSNLIFLFPTAILVRALGIFLKYHERWLPYLFRTYSASGGLNRLVPQLLTLALLGLLFLPLHERANLWVANNRIGIQVQQHLHTLWSQFLNPRERRWYPRSYEELSQKAEGALHSPLDNRLEAPYGFFPLEASSSYFMVWLYEKEPSDPLERYRYAVRRDGRVVPLTEKKLLKILELQREFYNHTNEPTKDRREAIIEEIEDLQTLF